MKIRKHTIFLLDTIVLCIAFYFALVVKQNSWLPSPDRYINSFLLFVGIWLLSSLLLNKYKIPVEEGNVLKPLSKIIINSAIVIGVISSLMYLTRVAHYSRMLVFGTLGLATLIEFVACVIFYWIKNATKEAPTAPLKTPRFTPLRLLTTRLTNKEEKANLLSDDALQRRQKILLEQLPTEVFDLISKYAPIDSFKTHVVSTNSYLNFDLLTFNVVESVINLKRINDVRYINKLFESINARLPLGGVYINFLETKNQRRTRILQKFPPVINYIYYFFDFILKRILPKFALTKKIYFILTRGQNRVFTKAEAFGRLYSCGFEVLDELDCKGHLYFVAVKTKDPLYPERPTYGPLIQLQRIGKSGKPIKVYKLRTMHPYSEFLQDYVYKQQGLQEGGKFKSDFRVSTIGKFFRMFWLDELPMLFNLIRRDMKIVGVRPLSKHYFSLYTKEHKHRRLKYKPGLVPPFYADNPKTLEEIMESEKRYFDAFDKHPFRTDLKYFFKAFYNILFKKARSA